LILTNPIAFFYIFGLTSIVTLQSALSPDAMPLYKIISLGFAMLSNEETPECALRFFEVGCRETELIGITPASLTMHGLLAMLHARKGNADAKLRHMDAVCRIGIESGLTRLLVKCAAFDIDQYTRHLGNYGKHLGAEIREKCFRFRTLWQLAYQAHSGSNSAIDVSVFEHEIVLLLIFKTRMEEIAELKNISVREVRKTIKDLCARLNLRSKKELVELFSETYRFSRKDRPAVEC